MKLLAEGHYICTRKKKELLTTKMTILILLLLFTSLGISAQEKVEKSTKGTQIPLTIKSKKGTEKAGLLTFNSKAGFKKAYSTLKKQKTKEQIAAELKNKGILSEAKIAEQNMSKSYSAINRQYKRVDQSLGSFRSNSKYVRVICRDFQYPDGDRVTIYLNNIPIAKNIVLESRYQEFKIPLLKGLNKIAFKALNQGTSGPNTAAFKVYDDAGSLISSDEWNLATGAVATLLIAKDN